MDEFLVLPEPTGPASRSHMRRGVVVKKVNLRGIRTWITGLNTIFQMVHTN